MLLGSMRKSFGAAVLIAVIACVAGYLLLSWQRHDAIRDVCAEAGVANPASRIDDLVACLSSSDVALRQKNRVIWVLGELRDERAIPALQALNVSATCDHDRLVCQREVRKALSKISRDTPNPYF